MKKKLNVSITFLVLVILCSAVLVTLMLSPLKPRTTRPFPAESITYLCQVCHVEVHPGEKFCPACEQLPPSEKYKNITEIL